MSTNSPLQVMHTIDYHQPALIVRNLPGPDAELHPRHARALAAALMQAADDCERLYGHVRWFGSERREYPL